MVNKYAVYLFLYNLLFAGLAMAQEVVIREFNDEAFPSELWDDYSSGEPGFIDFAKSLTMSSDFSDRIDANWARFLYDDWSRNGGKRNELLDSIDQELKEHFRVCPSWWSKAFLSCKLGSGLCVSFSVDKATALDCRDIAERITVDEVDYIQVAPIRGPPIRIRFTDFSLASPVENLAIAVQYSPEEWPERVFVCPFQQTSQSIRIWSFSSKGRLEWMQAVDFHNSENAMSGRCGSPRNGRVTLVPIRKITEGGGIRQNVALFGAWSNNVLVVELSGEDGRALNCFNTLQFPEL